MHVTNAVARLLEKAIKFTAILPFVNPARAPTSSVRLEGKKYVVQGTTGNKFEGLNAVFLTTGVVTECSLVMPTPSWVSAGGQQGPAVKRVRLRPFAIELERTLAFWGHFLDISKTNTFGGPMYANGLGFSTRKEGARKPGISLLSSISINSFTDS
jgi:hypothetical protein